MARKGLFRHPPQPQAFRPTATGILQPNEASGSFTSNAVIRETQTGSFTADAVLKKTQTASTARASGALSFPGTSGTFGNNNLSGDWVADGGVVTVTLTQDVVPSLTIGVLYDNGGAPVVVASQPATVGSFTCAPPSGKTCYVYLSGSYNAGATGAGSIAFGLTADAVLKKTMGADPPVVVSRIAGGSGASSSSHACPLPGSVSAGNVLILSIALHNPGVVTTPTGWTALDNATIGGVYSYVYWKIAVTSEPDPTVVTANDTRWSYTIENISGGDFVALATAATGNSAAPNPPSFTAPWGTAPNLWVINVAGQFDWSPTGSPPTGYAAWNFTFISNGPESMSSYRALSIDTEDPGSGSISFGDVWIAWTMAVRPVSSLACTLDAVLKKTLSVTFIADSVLRKTSSSSFTADAIKRVQVSGSFTANSVTKRTQTGSLSLDAVIRRTISGSFVADAVLRKERTGSLTADAVIYKAVTGSFTADAVLKKTTSSSFSADAIIMRPGPGQVFRYTFTFDDNADGWYFNSAWDGAVGNPPGSHGRGYNTDFFGYVGTWADLGLPTGWVLTSVSTSLDYFATGAGDAGLSQYGLIVYNVPLLAKDVWTRVGPFSSPEIDAGFDPAWPSQYVSEASLFYGTGIDGVTYFSPSGDVVNSAHTWLDNITFDFTARPFDTLLTADAIFRKTTSNSFIADAVIASPAITFTVDALFSKTVSHTFSAKAVIVPVTITGSFTGDAIRKRTIEFGDAWDPGGFDPDAFGGSGVSLDAIVRVPRAEILVADAVIYKTIAGSSTADAVLFRLHAGSFTADAVVFRTQTGSFTTDAVIMPVLTIDAVVRRAQTGAFTVDAVLMPVFRADAIILRAQEGSFTASAFIAGFGVAALSIDAVIKSTRSNSFSTDAVLLIAQSATFTVDAVIRAIVTVSRTVDAVILKTQSASITADAVIRAPRTVGVTADAVILSPRTGNFSANAVIKRTQTGSFSGDAVLRRAASGSATLDAYILGRVAAAFTADAVVFRTQAGSFTANASISQSGQAGFTIDAYITSPIAADFNVDAVVLAERTGSFTSAAIVLKTSGVTFDASAITRTTAAAAFALDAWIKPIYNVPIDAIIRAQVDESFTLDAVITVLRPDEIGSTLSVDEIAATIDTATIGARIATDFIQATLTAQAITATLTVVSLDSTLGLVSRNFTVDAVIV